MTKVLVGFMLAGGLFTLGNAEIKELETASETPIIELESNSEVEIINEEDEKEALIAEIKAWLSNYLEENTVTKIISWLVDAGVLGSLLGVYIKYRKYKHTTLEDLLCEFKKQMESWLKDKAGELSEAEIVKITKAIDDLQVSNEIIMKVLVLMQDNTAKGKVALLEYLGTKTNNKEIKQSASEVQGQLEQKIAENEEVVKKVAENYTDLF